MRKRPSEGGRKSGSFLTPRERAIMKEKEAKRAEAGARKEKRLADGAVREERMREWTKRNVMEAFSEEAIRLATERKRFVVFPDEGRTLEDEEYDDWCRENDLLSETRRYGFIPLSSKDGGLGYAVNAVGRDSPRTTLTVPMEAFAGSAEDAASAVLRGLGIERD